MMIMKNKIWLQLLAILLAAAVSSAIVLLMVGFYKDIKQLVPAISGSVCLLGVVVSFLLVRKHPSKQRRSSFLILGADYVSLAISILLYAAGSIWNIWVFFVMMALVVVNSEFARDRSMLVFYHVNTIFISSMSSLFCGLMYARYISDDWGTLLLTMIGGLSFAALGFILTTGSLLLFSKENQ